MPLTRVKIENFKSIKHCDISLSALNVFIGENGTGKTNILDAINYFYRNLTENRAERNVFDENNSYSNEVKITLFFDFSEFVKISKSNSDEPDRFAEQETSEIKYGGYYKTILAMASKSPNKMLSVTMTQIKGKAIIWNYSYEDRLVFKSLFPFFHLDTRSLDVTEWGYVWDILGELAKVSNEERKSIEFKIHEILLDNSKEISKKLQGITDIFVASDVTVKTAKPKDFAKNLSKVYFSGDTIHQSGKQLGYYSTGTNSIKYIELLIKSIDEIARTKLKEPVILIDEPEISLHPLFMDELSAVMTDVSSKLRIMVSTHSARLTKNIIVESDQVTLYNVKIANHYSTVHKMKKFPQYSPESKYRVTDDHINSYFSRAILFVEGETELELFSNPYLRLLFPTLKYVDVFQAMSQTPVLNIMNPRLTHTNVPYLCLIDMDKAISYDRNTKRFTLKGEYFKDTGKERYRYRNKHEDHPYVYHLRNRIQRMANKLHVHYYMPYISCDDSNLTAFLEAIHSYLMFYNVFSLRTTVEGCLINENTVDFALGYLQQKKKEGDFSQFEDYLSSLLKVDKLNSLRIVFNGKSDLLHGYKQLKKSIPDADCLLLDKMMIGKKTSGWVSEYLDLYFKEVSSLADAFSVKSFKKYLSEADNCTTLLHDFKKNFPELHSLITKVCDMISM